MSITATKFAVAPDIGRLQSAIAALIDTGHQPAGDPQYIDGKFVQRMDLSEGTQTVLNADGPIAVKAGTVVLTKGSAAAMTLAAPTAAQDGTRLRILNGTAFAHVITATNLLDDGVTGGAKDTATFGAFVGSAIELEAYNLKWIVVSKNVVTIAAV